MTLSKNDYSADPGSRPGTADTVTNPTAGTTFGEVLALRYSRRDALRGLAATGVIAALDTGFADALNGGTSPSARADGAKSQFTFAEIKHGVDETHHVAPGYSADVLIRWGAPVTADAPDFDPMKQSTAAQSKQFGYNCDFIGYFPLPRGSSASERALLAVNHEYTIPGLMFARVEGTREQVAIELAALGASIVEVRKDPRGEWQVVPHSRHGRRITAETPMRISGPAAGDHRLKTKADPTGTTVLGMLANCAGGQTPWGTYLSAEENFHGFFSGGANGLRPSRSERRYGIPGGTSRWARFDARFDIGVEPNEPNRFGWIVEIDPYDSSAMPRKRTALGRFRHEGAETILNRDGRVVVYSGDDQANEYIYRFVTNGRFDPTSPAANRDLLDSGALSVAKFAADGTLAWLPLVHGHGPLTAANGFTGQADVVIDARLAADLLGATKMDRPEDIEPDPRTGKVYAVMTRNADRRPDQVDGANPRGPNPFGHIIEIAPTDGDHAAPTARWELLIAAGNPRDPAHRAAYHPATSANGWFAAPDNIAFDPAGRLWVATDQGSTWSKSGTADGLWAIETDGAYRGYSRMFFRAPLGAEVTGPRFTPDGTTLFLSIQHPGAHGGKGFADPATHWPDFAPGMPPRPAVVAITRNDGGVIGA